MLRYKIRVTVYRKNELNNQREIDFPLTQEGANHMKDEIQRLLHGVHLVDDDGFVYVLGVSNIEENI